MNAKKLLFRTTLSTLGAASAACALSLGGVASIQVPAPPGEATARAMDDVAPVSTTTPAEAPLPPRVGNTKRACYGR